MSRVVVRDDNDECGEGKESKWRHVLGNRGLVSERDGSEVLISSFKHRSKKCSTSHQWKVSDERDADADKAGRRLQQRETQVAVDFAFVKVSGDRTLG
ncbi:hypothetical protein L2E82_11550 [Cichorium intybus]|uniref:Uncharacterized protein n=1 Tax=Cichorium intybus TaxID=13427 RepID=A0ACB9GER4_CICIN|nr:hypothetical protein L2E82_11550 [Cichorium intybus]